jgi:hypothetical protein
MRGRRVPVLLLLGVLALMAVGPFLAGLCGDDCAPDCSDCVTCGLVACPSAVPVLVVSLTGTTLPAHLPSSPSLSTPRQLDHVPLPASG